MDKVQTTIKFDWPALACKSIDVAHLVPELLALINFLKEANRYANGERAGIRVCINADLNQFPLCQ